MDNDETTRQWQERGAPVQPMRRYSYPEGQPLHPFPTRVPWHFHERAWSVYAGAGHGDQSAVRLAERGGFGVLEIVACLALGDYHARYDAITTEHVNAVRAEIEEWTSGNHALRVEIDRRTRERDEAMADRDAWKARWEDLKTHRAVCCYEMERERDEARAEVERLREQVAEARADCRAETERADHGHLLINERAEEARAYAERMMRERDAAQTELARLLGIPRPQD